MLGPATQISPISLGPQRRPGLGLDDLDALVVAAVAVADEGMGPLVLGPNGDDLALAEACWSK